MVIGRGVTVAIGTVLVVLGFYVGMSTPHLSGGTIAGSLLIALGGGLLIRLVQVAQRQQSRK